MIVYLDTSVVLRKILCESNPLSSWGSWAAAYISEILRVEALRSIDRLRLTSELADAEVAEKIKDIHDVLESVSEIPITPSVLARASQPFPVAVTTLDAIHLASAVLWRELRREEMLFATHDKRLGAAAETIGFQAIGI
ncbi:MAG TPA: type II toxin-antitoxin system VapC family toxin [Bdellovibrionota bacterium]|nr:type II toxin-antitoxin system VapC family toxin [Bdellovibrionota bacterium]